jgi:hypothetical protein
MPETVIAGSIEGSRVSATRTALDFLVDLEEAGFVICDRNRVREDIPKHIVFEREAFNRWWNQSSVGGTLHGIPAPDEVQDFSAVQVDLLRSLVEHDATGADHLDNLQVAEQEVILLRTVIEHLLGELPKEAQSLTEWWEATRLANTGLLLKAMHSARMVLRGDD